MRDEPACAPASSPSAALLTAYDVAAILACSSRTVYRLADQRLIPPPVRVGGMLRWSRQAIQAWIAAGCPKNAKSFSK